MPTQSDLRFTFTAGADAFDVIEFRLSEGLSQTFRLDVELSCANPAVDFGHVLDQPALLTIWQHGQPMRFVHGIVSSFVQADTGFRRTRYRATVEPRLARLTLASDWRIFQTLSVPDIAQAVLKKHGITTDYEQRITNPHLPREYCVQAGDTDYYFVERIMREEGFFYGFQHSAEGHRLIHCDRLFIFGKLDGEPVEYNPLSGGDQPQPALRRFAYTENVRTARQTQRDYDFKNPLYNQQTLRDGVDLERQARSYERYDYPGRYKHETGEAFTQGRLRGHRRDARIAFVEGDDPRLIPGLSFDLLGHPREDMSRGWRPVHIEHHGTQYTSQAEESAEAERGTHYSYTAELVPDDAEWRAEPLPRPRIDGPQQAVVVGPPGEEIYCDQYGRVKVQFPWDRDGKRDEHSSCWIRVSQNWAGATWGHVAIPRIGQEVIVSNFDGDPDQPVITGRTYNALQLPPYELPKFKDLATIRSEEHKGQRASELRLDDTPAEISAALMNDHGASHLHLGYLTHPRPQGGKPRGEGFELRTDERGAVRAAKGLLLTTEGQPQAQGGQLSRSELIQCLESALELARNLGNHAGQHQNLPHDAVPQGALADAVRELGHGANDEPKGGRGGQPLIAISSPAGIAAATPRAITLGAGEHLDAVAGKNQHFTAGQAIVMNGGQGIGQFAHSGDLRHIAHQGQVLIQAQQDTIRVQADKSVEISASNEHVLVMADRHITLLCHGAYIKLQDGKIELGCPGEMTFRAANYNWLGAANEAATLPQFDMGEVQRRFVLTLPDGERPAANRPYRITLSNGEQLAGMTDAQGATELLKKDAMHIASFELLSAQDGTSRTSQ